MVVFEYLRKHVTFWTVIAMSNDSDGEGHGYGYCGYRTDYENEVPLQVQKDSIGVYAMCTDTVQG